jgi:DNA adenine methylase
VCYPKVIILEVAKMGGINREPNAEAQPLLRWAGSKKRQFQTLKEYFPDQFETYAEPFAGSAAFLFRMGPPKAKISDINADLYDFYSYVQRSPNELYGAFRKIPRTAESYYRVRKKFNSLARGKLRTQYFYFLNRNCFNGIYRVNQQGAFNVPFSDNRVSPYLDAEEFERSCEIIARTKLFNKDFEPFCRKSISTGDFVFLDPPYYRLGSRIFNEYGVSEFVSEDFERLSRLLDHAFGMLHALNPPSERNGKPWWRDKPAWRRPGRMHIPGRGGGSSHVCGQGRWTRSVSHVRPSDRVARSKERLDKTL